MRGGSAMIRAWLYSWSIAVAMWLRFVI